MGAAWDGPGTWFFIGSSYTGTVIERGRLFLAFHDTDTVGNKGSVTAHIQVTRRQSAEFGEPPEEMVLIPAGTFQMGDAVGDGTGVIAISVPWAD